MINEVSADKAYSSEKNMQTVLDYGGMPLTAGKVVEAVVKHLGIEKTAQGPGHNSGARAIAGHG